MNQLAHVNPGPAPVRPNRPTQAAPTTTPTEHPRLLVWLTSRGEAPAHIEVRTLPGSKLGGPFTTGAKRASLERVSADDLPERHLAYLREAYQRDDVVKRELDQLAGMLKHGRNTIALLCVDECVARNVVRAVLRLAARLKSLEDA